MWFAALERCEDNSWLARFMERLREGEPAVRALLGRDPFGDAPPTYVRAELFDYHFTSLAEQRATGAWWSRRPLGPYCGP
jgi:lipase maturation factor 1